MSDLDDNDLIVRLGCYKVGPNEQVFRERRSMALSNVFRFRWLIAHKNADQDQPAIADLYVPDKDDTFVISFDPPLAGPITVKPQKDYAIPAFEKIPRVKLQKYTAGARYALTVSAPPEGVRPRGWPAAPITIGVNAAGDLAATTTELIRALNAKDSHSGAYRPWEAFPVSDLGIEFRLRDSNQFPDAHLSPLLEEMPVVNASNPVDIVSVMEGDDLFDPGKRVSSQHRSIGEFLDGCKQVDGSAVIARATARLREYLGPYPEFDEGALDGFCRAFASGLYAKFAREISLEDLLRESRNEKAVAFSRWFDGHIESCAAPLQIRGWTEEKLTTFKRTITLASRIVIREVNESIQGKNAVALAMAIGSLTPYLTTPVAAEGVAAVDHAALPELCGMELEFDASPFVDGGRYKPTKVTIQWTHQGHTQSFGLYRPDGNLDCFNGASTPMAAPPEAELVEDGAFVPQPGKSDKQTVFKSTSGDGLISVRITNAMPQSYWPAFFVYLSDDKTPPLLAEALASDWFSQLSVVKDPGQPPTRISLPSPAPGSREQVAIHWQNMLPLPKWTPMGKRLAPKPKYVWLFARSVAGGWLPPIPVNRNTTSHFGLKLPSSLSGLDSNQIPFLSTGTPEAPRLKRPDKDEPPALSVRIGGDGKPYLDVVINAVPDSSNDVGYYTKYGINELQMLVFRRPGDLPKNFVQPRHFALRTRLSNLQDDFAYYQATGWYNTLLASGWFPLPDIGVVTNPDPTKPELTMSYPAPVLGGWKYIAVIIAKRPQDFCYQVPRTAHESGAVADYSYFPVVGYVPDGVLLKADTPQAWRYLAAGYDTASTVPPPRDKAIRFEYSEAAITTEYYLPSPQPAADDVVTLVSM